jgi:hypothetical protein
MISKGRKQHRFPLDITHYSARCRPLVIINPPTINAVDTLLVVVQLVVSPDFELDKPVLSVTVFGKLMLSKAILSCRPS